MAVSFLTAWKDGLHRDIISPAALGLFLLLVVGVMTSESRGLRSLVAGPLSVRAVVAS